MKPFICFCWVIFATVWLSACGGRTAASSPRGGDTLDLRYAENLTLVDCGSYQMATLRNPWDTSQMLHTYLLVPRGDRLPMELPEGTVVRIPLERAVVFSSVHCALLEELGALDAIGGVWARASLPDHVRVLSKDPIDLAALIEAVESAGYRVVG